MDSVLATLKVILGSLCCSDWVCWESVFCKGSGKPRASWLNQVGGLLRVFVLLYLIVSCVSVVVARIVCLKFLCWSC